MTPQRHARVKELFLAACELPPERRGAFLEEACGDDADLRAQVEAQLAHHLNETLKGAPGLARLIPVAPTGADVPPPSAAAASESSMSTSDEERAFEPGHMIGGRYRIVTLLGRGGMGEVYRAEDLKLGQSVALKFLSREFSANRDWLARFLNEVRVARAVTNPHVCRVFDIGEADGEHFITMEYVDGEDLKTLLRRIGRMPQERAVEIARQICAGLAAAHARGVLHRDLKPSNVMLNARGNARITDFGLAGLEGQIAAREIRAGTPAYMAPEQLAGRSVSTRSDIYSLGLVLYELFTGKPAFRAESVADYLNMHEKSHPSLPSSLVPELDPAVERVIMRCLEKNPELRPDSALAVSAALPGGDPLAAALAAGETPSPDLVAAAGERDGLGTPVAAALLAACLVALLAGVYCSGRVYWPARSSLDKSPPVLAEKAREALRVAGRPNLHDDEAFGFINTYELHDVLQRLFAGKRAGWMLAEAAHDEILFWYRANPSYLVPIRGRNTVFESARLAPDDPPFMESCSALVILAPDGRLVLLHVAPWTGETAAAGTCDWSGLLRLSTAGEMELQPTRDVLLAVFAKSHRAWEGPDPRDATRRLRAECADDDGRPVLFAVFTRVEPDDERRFEQRELRERADRSLYMALMLMLTPIAVCLAWRHEKTGRSDRRGALRLALFVLAVRMLAWLLQARHVPIFREEMELLALALAGAVGEAVLIWLLYVALEPYVRRHWPQTLIAWTRLLRLKLSDPLVGRNLLVGTLVGAYFLLMVNLDAVLVSAFGLTPHPHRRPGAGLASLLGPRVALGVAFDALRRAIYDAMVFLLLLVALRIIVKRPLPAALLVTAIVALLYLPRMSHPAVSWLTVGVGCIGVGVWLMTRFGLLSMITAAFVGTALLSTPLTLNQRLWYADASLLVIALVTGLAFFGFHSARRRAA